MGMSASDSAEDSVVFVIAGDGAAATSGLLGNGTRLEVFEDLAGICCAERVSLAGCSRLGVEGLVRGCTDFFGGNGEGPDCGLGRGAAAVVVGGRWIYAPGILLEG